MFQKLDNLREVFFFRGIGGIYKNNIDYENVSDQTQQVTILFDGVYVISANSLAKENEKIQCYVNGKIQSQAPWTSATQYARNGTGFTYVGKIYKGDIVQVIFSYPIWASDTSLSIYKII